jgi:Asp-tRNA(Asn)/Glu-tRNA(Gln) amidotransferase A subunit family amidase
MNPKPWIAEEFEEAVKVLESLGATIVDDAKFPEWTLLFEKEHKEDLDFAFHATLRNSKIFTSKF